jgi:hypothetical protein
MSIAVPMVILALGLCIRGWLGGVMVLLALVDLAVRLTA